MKIRTFGLISILAFVVLAMTSFSFASAPKTWSVPTTVKAEKQIVPDTGTAIVTSVQNDAILTNLHTSLTFRNVATLPEVRFVTVPTRNGLEPTRAAHGPPITHPPSSMSGFNKTLTVLRL